MKIVKYGIMLVIAIWVVFAVHQCRSDIQESVCKKLCDARGRQLKNIDPGVITECYCGARKMVPRHIGPD